MEKVTLNSEEVSKTFEYCMEEVEGANKHAVKVEGIMTKAEFNSQRLAEKKELIVSMLNELPDPFKQKMGGGWSFLNACNDRNGEQWTGLHLVMEQLFLLGLAIKRVVCCMPREMWAVLPGGMPFYTVLEADK